MRCARCGGPAYVDDYRREWRCYWSAWTTRPSAAILARIEMRRIIDHRPATCEHCGARAMLQTRGVNHGHVHLCGRCYEMAETANAG